MAEKEQIAKVIVDSLHIDDEGLREVKVLNIADLQGLGVDDVAAFLDGLLDSENHRDVESFNEDYIKGYRYGETGKF